MSRSRDISPNHDSDGTVPSEYSFFLEDDGSSPQAITAVISDEAIPTVEDKTSKIRDAPDDPDGCPRLEEYAVQKNDPLSLENINEYDINNIYDKWFYVRKDLDRFSMMLLIKLDEISPQTMYKLNMEKGIELAGNKMYSSETLAEARKLVKLLNKILQKLDKQEHVWLLLSSIAGPYGYIHHVLTKEDTLSLVKATLQAIEGQLLRKLPNDELKSFKKVLFIIFSLIQDLSAWDDTSTIYEEFSDWDTLMKLI